MVVNYYRMSGDELKRIYKISQLKSEEFAMLLGIERHQLYTQFSRGTKSIDADVEKKVKSDPQLHRHQQILVVDRKDLEPSNDKSKGYPSSELWEKALEMLHETIRLVSDDNKFIKKDAEIFRGLVDQGIKTGAIRWDKPRDSNK